MLKIKSEELISSVEQKRKEGYTYLVKITAVDYTDRLEAIYFLRNLDNGKEEEIRVDLPAKNPKLASIMGIFMAADWYERELSEMFDIEILGRKAKRLLLEKWDGKEGPLRKSFVWGKPYKSIEAPVKFVAKWEEGAK
ncbi:MAG: NADH-quinone oxidoreductase subunit C [Candidatus Micrarchaeota archaeon]|nr:NADH-quinone oxidoreductase subunit C [Candidatus Micrarchaeota archaeon]